MIGIIIFLYIIGLCIPAFFFTFEKESPVDCFEGCHMLTIAILGFPGTLLGLLAVWIKKLINVAEQDERVRRNEIESREREKRYEIKRAERIAHYKQSPLMPDIINFITKHGMPIKIIIHRHCISVTYLGGNDTYYFSNHGIKNFPTEDCLGCNISRMYTFGCAINQILGNEFSVYERGSDHEVLQVDLLKPLKNF